MLVRIAATLALVVATAACTNGASPTGIPELSCPPGAALTYANFGHDLIARKCMSCHDTESPRLGTQELVRAAARLILDEAVYTDAMPEDTGMALSDRQALGEWLACGAP
jgi:uncharacterized membrane protein